jgi:hypothetical protein
MIGRDKNGCFIKGHLLRKGMKHTKETKIKIGKSSLGRKHTKKWKKEMSFMAKQSGVGKWMKNRKLPLSWRKNISKATKGNKNPNWKGGKYRRSDGYIAIHNPIHPYCSKRGGYVLEHRLVLEEILKRFLTREESVHHINKIKDDNRPQNLMLFITLSAHRRYEGTGKVKKEEIIFDGSKYKK